MHFLKGSNDSIFWFRNMHKNGYFKIGLPFHVSDLFHKPHNHLTPVYSFCYTKYAQKCILFNQNHGQLMKRGYNYNNLTIYYSIVKCC